MNTGIYFFIFLTNLDLSLAVDRIYVTLSIFVNDVTAAFCKILHLNLQEQMLKPGYLPLIVLCMGSS